MKKNLFALLFLIAGISVPALLQAQTQMLWDDPSELISSGGENILISKLAENDIEIVMTLDYKKRCDYIYTELTSHMNQAILTLYDCNRNVLGTKTWMSKFFALSEEEKISMISYSIMEIIENPATDKTKTTGDQHPPERTFTVPFNHHITRHFFAPTSYNLKAGELYYSTLYFALHDLQYGITNNFSIGMGTTVALWPFIVTPKFSHQIADKHSFSVGTMFMLGTWGNDFIGNLGYLTYTYGNQFNNVTLGLGYLYAEPQNSSIIREPIINLNGMVRMSDNIYFISENYYLGFNIRHTAAYYPSDPDWMSGANPLFRESFDLRSNVIAGMSGFRFINKKKNVSAFSFGLTYLFRTRDDVPNPYPQLWQEIESNVVDWKRFAIPTISFVSKLGKRV